MAAFLNRQYNIYNPIDESDSEIPDKNAKLNSLTYNYNLNLTWGGSLDDEAWNIETDIENNKIIVGSTESYGLGNKDIVILKYDKDDIELWNKTWGSIEKDEAFGVITDENCDVYIVGYTNNSGNADVVFLKYSKLGMLIWNKTWGGSEDDIATAVNINSNGSCYITGKTRSFGPGAFDIFLLKYNSSGELEWSQYWGEIHNDIGMAVDFDDDGYIYIAGYHRPSGSSYNMLKLLKYNSVGGLIRHHSFGGGGHWLCYDMKYQESRLYLVGCQDAFGNGGYDTVLCAFTTDLENSWYQSWGGSGDDQGNGIAIANGNSIFIAGKTDSFGSGDYDFFLAYYDMSYSQQWVKYWGGISDDICYDITLDYSNNIFLCGYTENYGEGLRDIAILKYATLGYFPIYIDDLNDQFNWNRTALLYDWCYGSGTRNDPYIIENLTIDGQNARSCVIIQNSDVYFKLRNLNLYNSGIIPSLPTPTYRSGILLSYVNNGQFSNITSSPGHGYGIYIEYCNNLTFNNINVSYNYYIGTYFDHSHYNNFTNLYADHMSNHPTLGGGYGVRVSLSDHNKFINVSADFNEEYGITINGWYNTFNNIEVKSNFDTGIFVYKGYNNITNSKILYNDKYGIILTHGADFSNIINNNISNNGITNIRMEGDTSKNINSVIRDNIISHASIGILMRGESTDGLENHLIVNNTFSYHSTRNILLEYAHNNNFWMNSFFGTKIEFQYTNNNNNWNNTQMGNFWSDYPYSDENDDGIGDLPHDLGDGNFDFLPIWRDGPEISILAPTQDLMTSYTPNFIIETHDPSLDSMWYTININTIKYLFDSNGTIDLNVWQSLQDGNNTIHFYANDTFGNINSEDVTVIKDTSGPVISLLNPIDSHAYDLAPHFNISFQDLSFNSSWYTINNELINYFFSGNSGYINQTKWDSLSQGIVQIIFYANDSLSQISNYSISIIKDTEAPLLTINSPTDGATFGTTPPTFNISVFDYSLNLTWFTIDDSNTIFPFIGDVFSLDQDTWNSLPQGNINITFYAKDSLGRISSQSITIRKEIPSKDSIPGANLVVLIGVVISVCIVLIRRLNRKLNCKNNI